ncbi:hypothetical protein ACTGJ9_030095 [Bradyrhizobium sp. RDM12]
MTAEVEIDAEIHDPCKSWSVDMDDGTATSDGQSFKKPDIVEGDAAC